LIGTGAYSGVVVGNDGERVEQEKGLGGGFRPGPKEGGRCEKAVRESRAKVGRLSGDEAGAPGRGEIGKGAWPEGSERSSFRRTRGERLRTLVLLRRNVRELAFWLGGKTIAEAW